MNGADLLDHLGMDAHKWATAFAELLDGRIVKGDSPDEDCTALNHGTLIGWFANAIMAGYDRGHHQGVSEAVMLEVSEWQRDVVNITGSDIRQVKS